VLLPVDGPTVGRRTARLRHAADGSAQDLRVVDVRRVERELGRVPEARRQRRCDAAAERRLRDVRRRGDGQQLLGDIEARVVEDQAVGERETGHEDVRRAETARAARPEAVASARAAVVGIDRRVGLQPASGAGGASGGPASPASSASPASKRDPASSSPVGGPSASSPQPPPAAQSLGSPIRSETHTPSTHVRSASHTIPMQEAFIATGSVRRECGRYRSRRRATMQLGP